MEATNTNVKTARLTIRISRHTLSFSAIDKSTEKQVRYEPYVVKSGISMAANLREAFKDSEMLNAGYVKAQVLLDTPILLIPIDEFKEEDLEIQYHHAFMGHDNDVILSSVLPDLNAVAVFSINKDLKLVIDDHFGDVRFQPTVFSVWNHMHHRSFTGIHHKLYGYFHDKKLDIFCFDKNRIKYANTFDVTHSKDAAYFLLYVWKQLHLDVHQDELYISGNLIERDELVSMLKIYVQKVFFINATAEFNRAPITEIKGIPFDLITLYIKKQI
jgi:hypothetical protein